MCICLSLFWLVLGLISLFAFVSFTFLNFLVFSCQIGRLRTRLLRNRLPGSLIFNGCATTNDVTKASSNEAPQLHQVTNYFAEYSGDPNTEAI